MKDIKIFISYHKKSKLLLNEILTPIHVGRAMCQKQLDEWLLENMIGDNTGKNISAQNNIYCELTAQYWAWQNCQASYIGFMHYRRFFNFENKNNIDNFKFPKNIISKYIVQNDIIVPQKLGAYSKKLNAFASNVREQWCIEHNENDMEFIYNRISNLYPEYTTAFDNVLNSKKIYWYNMFIMKKELFDKYCNWLFTVLDVNVDNFIEIPRIKGYLGEILFNVFIEHNKGDLKIKEIPTFKYVEPQNIPIVISTDMNYIPYCATVMLSVVNNLDKNYKANFYILTNGVTNSAKRKLTRLKTKKSFNVNFININKQQLIKFSQINLPEYISIMAYARLLLPDLLKNEDKIIYLDCDVLVLKDLSELYKIDINNYCYGGVEDVNYIRLGRNLNINQYGNHYINSGVLLINLKELRRDFSISNIDNNIKYNLGDQDIINSLFFDKIKLISTRWNMHHKFHDKNKYYHPDNTVDYEFSKEHPSIIHFVGKIKPWNKKYKGEYKDLYYEYYRKTPFYNNIVSRTNHLKDKLQCLFNCHNVRQHKILTIFGIKIKFFNNKKSYKIQQDEINILQQKISKLNKRIDFLQYSSIQQDKIILADSLRNAFIKHIDDSDFLMLVKKNMQNEKINNFSNTEVLIYLSALISNNEFEKVEYVFSEYISLWGLLDIHRYFLVANYAKSLSITNELIEKSCFVFKTMLENEKIFLDYVKNKTVAVVGNGPSEIGKNKGKEIDSHDIVIRMNNYCIKGFENDYGKKTDIWARGAAGNDLEDKTLFEKYDYCIWSVDYTKFPVAFDFLEIMYRDCVKNNTRIMCLPKTIRILQKESENFFPTTGFNVLCYLNQFTQCEKIDAYGFSFQQEKNDGYASHYFNDRGINEAITRSQVHSFNLETEYLRKLSLKNSNKSTIIKSE